MFQQSAAFGRQQLDHRTFVRAGSNQDMISAGERFSYLA
jgi:hypothetical protein